MGKAIAIFNQKGGVGKTTTNINLGASLAMLGKKVLIVDIDPQGNTTSGIGVSKKALSDTVYELLIQDNYNTKKAILKTGVKGLDVIPANVDLAGAEIELVALEGRETRLKKSIDKVRDDYDFIFIDCPPSLGLLTINSLTAVESVLIPIQCEFYALEGVAQLLESMKLVMKQANPNLRLLGVLATMYDKRTSLSAQVYNEIKKYFKQLTFKTTIPRNVRVAEAPSHGVPVGAYDKFSKGAKAYKEFTKEVEERTK